MRFEKDAGVASASSLDRDAAPPPGDTPSKAKVFISCSRSDEAFAITLGREIEARGIEVLRDVDDTLPGEEWCRCRQSLPMTEAWQAVGLPQE
jgi:hypothetical protein